ncbi:hypothetical protein LJC35_04620 [Parabacteroides sp. OttesenSCG-928-N08]|nr:hypothetical protein [Parabacteroides sp. OttesenSCG-928-N08]
MKEILNNELIGAIKDRILEDRNLATFLMDTLAIGKEASYRRLRGEVPFSFYEAAIIAKALGLSLDQIAGHSVTEAAMFTYNVEHSTNPMAYFQLIFKRYSDIFYYISKDPLATANTATNFVPFTFYFQFPHLSKFMLCRWMHQNQKIRVSGSMDNVCISENIIEQLKIMGESLLSIPTTNIIVDQNMYSTLIQSILYFKELNLISVDDVHILRTELSQLLDMTEEVAALGRFSNGNKLQLFLSNINFECTYSYLEKPDFFLSMFHVFVIDYISSHHHEIGKKQKEWIQSLKRYSTLISQCGEKQRVDFFQRQREVIKVLNNY